MQFYDSNRDDKIAYILVYTDVSIHSAHDMIHKLILRYNKKKKKWNKSIFYIK